MVRMQNGLVFVMTCEGCPEQYDVFLEDGQTQVGYVRLRWGYLYCAYPAYSGEVIYDALVGDGWTGRFRDEKQRNHHLKKIAKAIKKRYKKEIKSYESHQ